MVFIYLFLEFFKIGLFTFGGAYAMIPLVKEVVLKYRWLTEERFYDFIGVCESTPGPIAVNMATYVGSSQAGILGSIVATIAVTLPSFIIIVLIASILNKFTENKYFKRTLQGIKPVIIGLILSTGITLCLKQFGLNELKITFDVKQLISLIVFIIIALIYYGYKIIFKKKFNAILLIFLSALISIILSLILL